MVRAKETLMRRRLKTARIPDPLSSDYANATLKRLKRKSPSTLLFTILCLPGLCLPILLLPPLQIQLRAHRSLVTIVLIPPNLLLNLQGDKCPQLRIDVSRQRLFISIFSQSQSLMACLPDNRPSSQAQHMS